MGNERASSIIRIAAGAYLLYIAYSLIKSLMSGEAGNQTLIIVFIAVFIILGAIILFFGVRGMVQQSKQTEDETEDIEDSDVIEDSEEIEDSGEVEDSDAIEAEETPAIKELEEPKEE